MRVMNAKHWHVYFVIKMQNRILYACFVFNYFSKVFCISRALNGLYELVGADRTK